jgi:hypothetical protein
MAMLDPRLLDLLETLTASRLDWLAFELLEAIQAGRAAEETEAALAATRRAISSNAQPKPRGEPAAQKSDVEAIVGDDQIAWAARHVADRLDAALEQLIASIDALDLIVGEDIEDEPETKQALGCVLVLEDAELPRKATRDDAVGARAAVPALRAGLEAWINEILGSPLA